MIATIGRLDERITIQQKSRSADGQGGGTTTWGPLATVAAEEIPLTVAERLQAASIGSQVNRRFRIRHRTDVTPAMRIYWRTHVLEIHGVTNDRGDRQWLLLDCSEVV